MREFDHMGLPTDDKLAGFDTVLKSPFMFSGLVHAYDALKIEAANDMIQVG